MKKILCPTDFSDTANNAIVYAAKVAQALGAELILFNVRSLFDLSPVELIKGSSTRLENTKVTLEQQALEVSREFDISCYGEVQLSGVPLSSLLGAHGAEYDMIVMGTNGPDDLYQFFSGSNTYNVIRKTRVPLLVVPEGAIYTTPSLVIFAFDYWREGMPPFSRLSKWVMNNTELRLLELLEPSTSPMQDDEVRTHQKLIKNMVDDKINLTFDVIHTDNLPASIQSYMMKTNADLLILSTHEYSIIQKLFHKSLTKAVTSFATYPVLIIHD